ncbi:hypothetical protein [Moorella stamsii]|uniref:hypothetical protein n=1 Tax=Neomoorella stamsii TaxID=1266720 RepID=UPI0006D569A2|nr:MULTISPECIES: hypothetical protein [Moorella]
MINPLDNGKYLPAQPEDESKTISLNRLKKEISEVRKSSIINRKPLVTAHNIFHDLENIWSGNDSPSYGVTETEKILAEGTK